MQEKVVFFAFVSVFCSLYSINIVNSQEDGEDYGFVDYNIALNKSLWNYQPPPLTPRLRTVQRYMTRRPWQVWDDVMTDFQFHTMENALGADPITDADKCEADLALIFDAALTKNQQWALLMIDSWGKPGSMMFRSNPSFWGDYDTCRSVEPGPDYNITTQYCTSKPTMKKILNVKLPQSVRFNMGLCLPMSCSGNDARSIINNYLKKNVTDADFSFSGISCLPNELPLTEKAKSVIVVLSFFSFFMVFGSLYDVLIVRGYWRELTCQYNTGYSKLTEDGTKDEHKAILGNSQKDPQPYKPGWIGKLFLSFSVRSNAEKILALKCGSSTITCINGIRFYSMAWVVLGHAFSGDRTYKINSNEYQAAAVKDWTFQALTNALVSVDTFFLLSGLLVTLLALKELDKTKLSKYPSFLGKFYFHRFWRLTPPYMLVLMTYAPLFKYVGDGPFWAYNGYEKDECEETWWRNMLYVNNVVENGKGMCMGVSWYLANDMQFYVISPFIIIPLFFLKTKGIVIPLAALLANMIGVGVMSSDNNCGPNGGCKDWHQMYYIKPWTRIGAYIVGMITGWLLYKTKCKAKMNGFLVLIGWIAATATGLAALYGQYGHQNGNPMSTSLAAFYNAAHRPAWSASICWVIFACANGYGGPINAFLSWSWLLPLSRLTYCSYLVHMCVINYFFRIQRVPFYLNNINMIFAFLAILWITFFLAFIASMAFEMPFLGLEKLIFAFLGWVGSLFKKSKGNSGPPMKSSPGYTVKYSSLDKKDLLPK